MTRSVMFGPYGPLPSITASYEDGLATGIAWKAHDRYVPGGPWVCPVEPILRRDDDWRAYCAATAANNAAWLSGWHDGRARRRAA